MSRRILPGLLLVCASAGCVTRADHEATLRELASTRASLTAEHANTTELQTELGERDKKVAGLSDTLADRDTQLSSLTVEHTGTEQRLAKATRDLMGAETRAEAAERSLAESLKKRASLTESVAQMTEALGVLAARNLEAQARNLEYRAMLDRFRTLIDAGTLDVRMVDGRMVLTLPMDVLFASGSAKLSKSGAQTIATVGATLASIPDKRFEVEGHTDDVPIHNDRFASNWELASARALVVVHALLDAKLAPQRVSAASYGEWRPRADNRTDQGRAANRRIEIVVVPDLSAVAGG